MNKLLYEFDKYFIRGSLSDYRRQSKLALSSIMALASLSDTLRVSGRVILQHHQKKPINHNYKKTIHHIEQQPPKLLFLCWHYSLKYLASNDIKPICITEGFSHHNEIYDSAEWLLQNHQRGESIGKPYYKENPNGAYNNV
jgi:hypothetical protein